ncbi:MAG: molybdopterin converting factor subunit 1 [Chloroflexi bacterium]|nr:molybdopterin converting factor subunit 1 [Chloroflexota bacterium]
MNLTIRFFATLKDRVGAAHLEIEIPEPATVNTLLTTLVQRFPALGLALDSIIVAVNQEFADPGQILAADDEIVLFPPVSGG